MNAVKAVVMQKNGNAIELAVRKFPEPELEPGAVLLKTLYSEVCGTDVHLLKGQLAGVPYPIIPGHINVGAIEKMGGDVFDLDGCPFKAGDEVVFLDVHETCHSCWYCLVAKASTRCPNRKVYGVTYSAEDGLLGGWSEKIYLKPGVNILRLPEELPAKDFIAGGCGAPTALHAVERAGIGLNDSVVVQGCGPVGVFAAVFAMLSGAGQVVAIDPSPVRLAVAETIGVDHTIAETSAEERLKAVIELTSGRGADVTIEASGNPKAVPEGLAMTRDNGTYCIVGQYTDAGDVSINPHLQINKKHIDIRGTWGIDYSHFYKCVQLMARHRQRFNWHRMISRFYPLEDVASAIEDVQNLKVFKAVIAPGGEQRS
jgi:L-iditol 2-dehydrogenase